MEQKRIRINNIPAIIWGKSSNKLYIAVHGNMSNKEDEVIKIFAKKVIKSGYQLLSFDLPEHGERKEDISYPCKVQNCVADLKQVMEYVKFKYNEINIWACSMGAYFSLLAYKDENIKQCIFLSPVINMKYIIDNMMFASNITEDELRKQKEIKTEFGQTLHFDYYEYVIKNKIENWNKDTYILYGDKDNIQSLDVIKDFTNKYNCKLTILKDGKHYFHSVNQINCYKAWLDEVIL